MSPLHPLTPSPVHSAVCFLPLSAPPLIIPNTAIYNEELYFNHLTQPFLRTPSVASGRHLFTSESVSMGHPDKLADQISDGVLDALTGPRSDEPRGLRNAGHHRAVRAGRRNYDARPWSIFSKWPATSMKDVGYLDAKWGIGWDTCSVLVALHSQSPDIAMGVNEDQTKGKEIGAGDQGLMFGYAINDTPELMPLPIALAHRITNALTDARKRGLVKWLRPDSKSQVTVEYDGNKPVRIDTVVVSTQHDEQVQQKEIHDFVIKQVIEPCLPRELVDWQNHVSHQSDRPLRRRRTARRYRADRPQNHRRHLRRLGPSRRRRLQRQGSDEGRSQRRLHGAARGQKHRGRRLGRSLRSAVGLRHRRHRSGQRARSTPKGPAASTTSGFAKSFAICSRCRPAASSSISTCAGRFTARRPPAATSVASEKEFTWESTHRATELAEAAGVAAAMA